ncbi:MAG: transporter permease [Microbacteriaceae bacterium]|nr:transporter permease [Microbacteriaceae bacterium]
MTDTPARSLWSGRTLALLGIILVAANLRTAVTALSPIVTEVSADIPLSALAIGVLGMLPPVCFAAFGIVTPVFTRRIGLERMLVLALAAILVGHVIRGVSGSLPVLLLGSVIAFAGLGIGNVLLPPLVKKYFPDRVGLVTSLYATVLSISTLVPPLIAVPVADSAGWRISLGQWALLALLALVPWVTLLVREAAHRRTEQRRTEQDQVDADALDGAEPAVLGRVWRSSVAWAITIVFTVSSLNAYAMFAWLPQLLRETAGVSAGQAGVLLSLYAAMGIPTALVIPVLTARLKNVGVIVYAGALAFLIGDLGLLLAPSVAPWLWVAFAGLGPLFFPLSLVLINLRTRTHDGSVALSGFVQSVGYTIGALGPIMVGVLRETTGGWTWPLIALIITALTATISAVVISRPHMLEDDLNHHR